MPKKIPKLYEVLENTKYLIFTRRVFQIEEASDDVITEDELCDLMKTDRPCPWQLDHDAIKQALNEWKAAIKPGEKSIEITDNDLMRLFDGTAQAEHAADLYGNRLHLNFSDYIDGVRRKGNKMCLYTPPVRPLKATKATWRLLLNQMMHTVNQRLGGCAMIQFNNAADDYKGSIEMMKKLFGSFEEIKWFDRVDPDEIIKARQIWDNPAMFEK